MLLREAHVEEVVPLSGPATPQQRHTLRRLGVDAGSVRPAAFGFDVFAYVEDSHSTLRVQIAPSGEVVGQTVLNREPLL